MDLIVNVFVTLAAFFETPCTVAVPRLVSLLSRLHHLFVIRLESRETRVGTSQRTRRRSSRRKAASQNRRSSGRWKTAGWISFQPFIWLVPGVTAHGYAVLPSSFATFLLSLPFDPEH
jgi:hypothetical protein